MSDDKWVYWPPDGFRGIPKAASQYVLSPKGFVFNLKTGRMLKQQWDGYNTYTIIRNKEGKQYRFNHSKIDDPDYKPLTKDWVLNEDGAKVVPEYPDYAVSHYGAVYRINPKKTGPRAGEVFMLSEFTKQGHSYVKLSSIYTKTPRDVRVDKLVRQLWGDESSYSE
jgi:hypothetical protein